jgi:hypothetical protein
MTKDERRIIREDPAPKMKGVGQVLEHDTRNRCVFRPGGDD